MSDSRLEKFIYAICSMDVTDLPVPLSQIEKLWNCLITGETPDFEPLSRNEKYLMAMLDRYDISNLPAPMSRGEKLLYKIAVGETDLSDVPGYLSRYEELLKYLIENGGISGGDFEYVLYTLNQSLYTLYTTAEKPVKSAILSGQTLVNLITYNKTNLSTSKWNHFVEFSNLKCDLKSSTKYLLIFNITNYNVDSTFAIHLNDTSESTCFKGQALTINGNGVYKAVRETKDDLSNISRVLFTAHNPETTSGTYDMKIMIIEYQDGMENWDIPYFEGMQSVKMPVLKTTGKNLFDGYIVQGSVNTNIGSIITTDSAIRSNDYIELIGGETYTISKVKGTKSITIVIYDENKNFVRSIWAKTFTLNINEKYIKFADSENDLTNLYQIEQGSVATSYEPYKSNILTVNEDVELRGVGDVKDELNCLTGEVTKRIGEIVLDGSEDWKESPTMPDGFYKARVNIGDDFSLGSREVLLISDRFTSYPTKGVPANHGNYILRPDHSVYDIELVISDDDIRTHSLQAFKQYLQDNPTTVQYRLTTESIKTVDLTTVDQDNKPTKLGTFENITHVSLESAGLIPTVEMEVATNLLEDTVFNLTNAFNTLYPTAAKPVVDGTLYGQTLVNRVENQTFAGVKTLYESQMNNHPFKAGETFTVFVVNPNVSTVKIGTHNASSGLWHDENVYDVSTNKKILYTVQSNLICKYTGVVTINENDSSGFENSLVIVEGDKTHLDINTYFEGIKSVQAPGITMTNEDNTKSATLSTPSDLELRKVGEVQDELNVITGEVVERIGEMVLDGSESWSIHSTNTNTVRFVTYDKLDNLYYFGENTNMFTYIMCDTFSPVESNASTDTEGLQIYSNKNGRSDLKLRILNTKASTIDELKAYLTQHPITIQYRAKENTKTINLTIRNQDGNETKLTTFDDTTHVLFKSEVGPNPGASLTVRTKIPSASSTSLLMDDISTEQQQLESTVDEQSNNVDATMIATTEIYEETL